MVVKAATVLRMPTHQITVLRGDASTLPDIPPPPVSLPQISAPAGEPNYVISFGATIYDHRLSHVQWRNPKTEEEFEAWCGWDWNLLSPISQIEHETKSLLFFLFPSNVDTTKMVRFGRGFKMPAHPEVPADALDPQSFPIKVIASMPTFQPGNDVYLGHSSGQPVILYLNQPLTTLEEEDVQAQEAYYYWADSGNKEVSVSFDVTHQQNAPGQREPSGGVLV